MKRQNISSGSSFEQEVGYSRAVIVNNMVFLSGCTGFDYQSGQISHDVVAQAEQTITNIQHALAQAGATLSDVVRVQYLLTDVADFELCKPVFKKHFGDIRPACTAYLVNLIDPRMKIEIEATAVLPDGAGL